MTHLHYQLASGKLSTQVALVSFGIGTLLFITHLLLPHWDGIIFTGLVYIALAFFINSLVLFYLLYCYIVFTAFREFYAIKILIVLGNIPIAMLYLLIITQQLTIH